MFKRINTMKADIINKNKIDNQNALLENFLLKKIFEIIIVKKGIGESIKDMNNKNKILSIFLYINAD